MNARIIQTLMSSIFDNHEWVDQTLHILQKLAAMYGTLFIML